MEPLTTSFGLDADISLSELRSEETLATRLRKHPALRVRRRNDVLGVLVNAELWRQIEDRLRELENLVEEHEDDAVRAIIAKRVPKARFAPVTEASWSRAMRRYRQLTGE